MVSHRVRASFLLGSIPVAGRGNTPHEISPRGGNLFPTGDLPGKLLYRTIFNPVVP
jgi:hypothetical protein